MSRMAGQRSRPAAPSDDDFPEEESLVLTDAVPSVTTAGTNTQALELVGERSDTGRNGRRRALTWLSSRASLVVAVSALTLVVVVLFSGNAARTTTTAGSTDMTSDNAAGIERQQSFTENHTKDHDHGDTSSTVSSDDGSQESMRQEELSRLVRECARSLEIPGLHDSCALGVEGSSVKVKDNSYHVPYMTSSGGLLCGFEGVMTKEVMDELGDKYVFRFIGDSTTRRLAESFSSIYTGLAISHVVYHRRQDYSIGNLKIVFDWAPTCAGVYGLGAMVAKAMREETAENIKRMKASGDSRRNSKRIVIVTGFGIHDATQIQDYQDLPLSTIAPGGNETAEYELYVDARKGGVLASDSFNDASMKSCNQVALELTRVAAAGAHPAVQPLWKAGRAVNKINEGKQQQLAEQGVNGGSHPTGAATKINGAIGASFPVQWDEQAIAAGKADQQASAETESLSRTARDKRQETASEDGEHRDETGERDNVAKEEGDEEHSVVAGSRGGRRSSRLLRPKRRRRDSQPPGGAAVSTAEIAIIREGDTRRGLEVKSRTGPIIEVQTPPPELEVEVEEDPPVVFLLQNNPFLASDRRDPWLRELQELQRRAIDECSGECQRNPFLVDDRESLYKRMACYRADDIHFLEPVKLTEAKMLWHLTALL